jgi:hypothetical protein
MTGRAAGVGREDKGEKEKNEKKEKRLSCGTHV